MTRSDNIFHLLASLGRTAMTPVQELGRLAAIVLDNQSQVAVVQPKL